MKRFGTIFPFVEAGRESRRLGRLVANHDFARALVTYGSFDEYVFSNPSRSNLAMFAETVASWNVGPARLARVRYAGYRELPALLRDEPFHVFHLGGWGALMPGLHAIRARHARHPWPITAVTHSLNGREVIDHAARLSHAGMAACDAIVCTSRDGREAMRRLLDTGAAIAGRRFAGSLAHLPLGIDDALFDTPGDRERGRARLEIDPSAVVLLVLGRLTPFQKMDVTPLLRVLCHDLIPAAQAPVCLVFAGGGTSADIQRLCEAVDRTGAGPHVRLQANFSDRGKADLLAASDVLVSPVDNTQETFGLSLLEGMAAGLPIVASRFDGYKDLVEDGVDGFLIDTYESGVDPMEEWFDLMDPTIAQLFQSQGVAVDVEQMAARLLTLINDADLRRTMGAAGRRKGSRDFRWSAVVSRYEAMWDRLAEKAARLSVHTADAPANAYSAGPRAIFPHYTSATLAADARLVRTARPFADAPFNETAPVLRRDLLGRILHRARDGASVGDLAALAPGDAEYAAAWLLKYGLLRVEPA